MSRRHASAILLMSSSSCYYRARPRDDRAERAWIKEIAETRLRYGMPHIQVLMCREGRVINHKKRYRIYCEGGLNIRRKRPRRRVAAMHRESRPVVEAPNEA